MEDIQPRKSIRNIPVPRKRASAEVPQQENRDLNWEQDAGSGFQEPPRRMKPQKISTRGGSRWRIWAVAAVSLVLVVFAISVIFERATVRLTPKSETIAIDSVIEFERGAGGSGEEIAYEVVNVTVEDFRAIDSLTTATESTRARGVITLYNNHSDEPFELVEQTRFESPEGNIYRIQERVSIPGRSGNGAETIPGTLDVEVVADDIGSEFNVGPTEFTVPGLEGTSSFKTVYAKTDSGIGGGAREGEMTIPEADVARVENELRGSVEERVRQKIANELPYGFVLLESLSPVTLSSSVEQGEDQPRAVVTGSVKAVIVDEEKLSRQLLGARITEGESPSISIVGIDSVTAEYVGEGVFDPTVGERFSAKLIGQATFVWDIDKEALVEELSGVSKKTFKMIMDEHAEIMAADLVIRPIWKRTFPEKTKDIVIINTFEESEE